LNERIINIAVSGNPHYHVELWINFLNSIKGINASRFIDKFQNIDIVYWVFGGGPSVKKFPLFWLKKNPILIIHWIGSDVLYRLEYKQSGLFKLSEALWDRFLKIKESRNGVVHLALAEWLVPELRQTGITAEYLPISTIDTLQPTNEKSSSEREYDFLSYIPSNRGSFYGEEKILSIAKKLNTKKFIIIRPDILEKENLSSDNKLKNVTYLPRKPFKEMSEIYLNSKCFLRFTKHDSLSLSVLEALYYKEQVFWTYDYPNVHCISKTSNLIEKLDSTISDWKPNIKGHNFVKENFNMEKIKADYHKKLNEIVVSRILNNIS
jgi:hypothetical protein